MIYDFFLYLWSLNTFRKPVGVKYTMYTFKIDSVNIKIYLYYICKFSKIPVTLRIQLSNLPFLLQITGYHMGGRIWLHNSLLQLAPCYCYLLSTGDSQQVRKRCQKQSASWDRMDAPIWLPLTCYIVTSVSYN